MGLCRTHYEGHCTDNSSHSICPLEVFRHTNSKLVNYNAKIPSKNRKARNEKDKINTSKYYGNKLCLILVYCNLQPN